jgi:hypothetical protein
MNNNEEIKAKIRKLYKDSEKVKIASTSRKESFLYKSMQEASSEEEMLEIITNAYFLPIAKFAFEQDVGVKEVFLSAAQYWNDEADDAVHLNVQFSNHDYTSWEKLNSSDNLFSENIVDTYTSAGEALFRLAIKNVHSIEYGFYPDNYENFIACFGGFCKEGCSQETDYIDAYTPVVVAFKQNNEVKTKVIGKKAKILE